MTLIEKYADQVIAAGSYEPLDRIYLVNRIRALVGQKDQEDVDYDESLVTQLIELAIKNKVIEDSITEREILNDQLYDLLTPRPSVVNRTFWEKYQESPQKATDWFYGLCERNDYVKVEAIKKNVVFESPTKYGNLEITINLSKPEKDPKAIAQAAHDTAKKYPQCALCMENEGFKGQLGQAARSNHRIIRTMIGGQKWGFQYSPYAYFNEHCIFLDSVHEPMKINQQTLINLIEIEKQFPHYFVGSNADLPIVGGSMLAHEHYQGGKHIFPMMKAQIKKEVKFDKYPEVKAGIVNWPMSDLRLISQNPAELIELGTLIINKWQNYSDESLDIVAKKDGVLHHTVTPIMHREKTTYICDLVLRDNNTSSDYPLGIFHPHQEYWHIKKENIGLIEVMGRAILPGRLKKEMEQVKLYLLGKPNKIKKDHLAWADDLKKQNITPDNVDQVIQTGLANVFSKVLENAGVYKDDAQGQAGFERFIDEVKK